MGSSNWPLGMTTIGEVVNGRYFSYFSDRKGAMDTTCLFVRKRHLMLEIIQIGNFM